MNNRRPLLATALSATLARCMLLAADITPEQFQRGVERAESGNAEAQFAVGICYRDGTAVERDEKKAFEWLEKSAEQGHLKAQYNLASCYEYGIGVRKSIIEAKRWYRRAAEKGDVDSQFALGYIFYKGEERFSEKDEKAAIGWFEKAAAQGDATSMFLLGCIYEGSIKLCDLDKALYWYREAAAAGHKSAQASIDELVAIGVGKEPTIVSPGPIVYAEADIVGDSNVERTRVKAEHGDVSAQTLLGMYYAEGALGVKQDYSLSVSWYRLAAEQGNPLAQFELGLAYYIGRGVEEDYDVAAKWLTKAAEEPCPAGDVASYFLGGIYARQNKFAEAVKWLRKAAEQKSSQTTNAQFELGILYHVGGHGLAADLNESAKWMERAAENGHAKAQFLHGVNLLLGDGVEQDAKAAVAWFRKAAENGDDGGQYQLGWCYGEGVGVEKDYGKAVEWLRKAAASGNAEAQEYLDKLNAR